MCTGSVCALVGWDSCHLLDSLVLVDVLVVICLLVAGPPGILQSFDPLPRLGPPPKPLPGVEPAKTRPFLRSTRSDPTLGPPRNGLPNRIVSDPNQPKPCGFVRFDFQTLILGGPRVKDPRSMARHLQEQEATVPELFHSILIFFLYSCIEL